MAELGAGVLSKLVWAVLPVVVVPLVLSPLVLIPDPVMLRLAMSLQVWKRVRNRGSAVARAQSSLCASESPVFAEASPGAGLSACCWQWLRDSSGAESAWVRAWCRLMAPGSILGMLLQSRRAREQPHTAESWLVWQEDPAQAVCSDAQGGMLEMRYESCMRTAQPKCGPELLSPELRTQLGVLSEGGPWQ